MPVLGPNYSGETPAQITAREAAQVQVQSEVLCRNLIAASPGVPAVTPLINAVIAASEAKGQTTEISPSTTIDTTGTSSNKHK